jgi:NADPH-dependent curcumin reductase CurA
MSNENHEIRLASRPAEWPDTNNFKFTEAPMPQPGDGEILVRNIYMSVDPYMRGRMRNAESYIPPCELDAPLEGHAVGQVIESNSRNFTAGEFVSSTKHGWREYYAAPAEENQDIAKIEADLAPLPAYLGVLGMPGLTAYAGLLEVGAVKQGETVMVSAASGAVGSVVGQIARIKGCHVVGSAGSDDKVRYLTDELGYSAGFNYKTRDLDEALAEHCPQGIDVYFDNVGGALLEAVLNHMHTFGRIAVCGMISQYNKERPDPGPANLFKLVAKRVRMQGFLVFDYAGIREQFYQDMGQWLRDGQIKHRETIVRGLRSAPQAFIDLMRGRHFGKMVVQLADDPT